MRFLPLMIIPLLLAACGSQGRTDRESRWENYDPTVRQPTYDETYVPPSELNADQLVERAMRAESQGRDDQARVDYHQAFRRDRWHPQANRRYQDLMLRNGLFEDVWQEYLDLWQQNPERGDALWFHLRPMLIQREDQPLKAERRKKLTAEEQTRLNELLEAGDTASAVQVADLPEVHFKRIELATKETLEALLADLAERVEENPASGDAIGMHALALSSQDAKGALAEMREAWILEMPGVWLYYAIGKFCEDLAMDYELPFGMVEYDIADVRDSRGWHMLAVAFYSRFLDSRPEGVTIEPPISNLELRAELLSDVP